MKNEFVPCEEALALRELGFDKPCLACYVDQKFKILDSVVLGYSSKRNNDYGTLSAPLFQQAFRWFRTNYGLMHIINPYNFSAEIDYLNEKVENKKFGDFIPHDHLLDEEGEVKKHLSYEEAELACLRKLIKIVKDDK